MTKVSTIIGFMNKRNDFFVKTQKFSFFDSVFQAMKKFLEKLLFEKGGAKVFQLEIFFVFPFFQLVSCFL